MTWLADIVLAAMMLEAVLLGWRRALAWPDLAGLLLPGVALVVALRLALAGAALHWLGLALIAAWGAHLYDLRRRIRRV